jgi:glycerophosphoryl diester phosphodiesterase
VAIAFELKSDRFLDPDVCRRFSEELSKTGLRERSMILSFSVKRLRAMQEVDADLPTGWITMKRAWPPSGIEMFGPFWPLLFINPCLTWIAKLKGQLVCPLDPTPEPRIQFYRFLGCDALLTDDPAKTAQALGRSLENRNL